MFSEFDKLQYIQFKVTAHGMAEIILNRPDKHNALNKIMIQELNQVIDVCKNDNKINMVVLTANGESFCAGADLNYMREQGQLSFDENYADAEQLAQLFNNLYYLAIPIIAKVQGAIYGGGLGLIVCADIVFANKNIKMCFSEVSLGIIPALISPYIVNTIGVHAAKRYLLSAEMINFEKALSLNLVHEVYEAYDLEANFVQLINKIQNNSFSAMIAMKKLLFKINNIIDEDIVDLTIQQLVACRKSDNAQQLLNNFLQRNLK